MIFRSEKLHREGPAVYLIVSYNFLGFIPFYINKKLIR
ncbi:hypothetical protein b3_0198 [Synechococcus phage B3]|nr:hypothetical protein b3_0198 [Synechococcus phage B3]QGT54811.1 hypothetical protein b23_0196 [Synechococcus phage B23]